jgi:peroxiredoxin
MAYGACDSPDAKTPKRISFLIGEDGKVRVAYPKVSPEEHPQEVLEYLGA